MSVGDGSGERIIASVRLHGDSIHGMREVLLIPKKVASWSECLPVRGMGLAKMHHAMLCWKCFNKADVDPEPQVMK